MDGDVIKPAPRGVDNFDTLSNDAYLSVPAEAAIFGVSVNTAWRWHREGRLPPTVKLSPGCTRVRVGALRELLARGAA